MTSPYFDDVIKNQQFFGPILPFTKTFIDFLVFIVQSWLTPQIKALGLLYLSPSYDAFTDNTSNLYNQRQNRQNWQKLTYDVMMTSMSDFHKIFRKHFFHKCINSVKV